MQRKRIGIPGALYDKIWGVNYKYMDFASMFGDVKILTPNSDDEPEDIDILMLPGGKDSLMGMNNSYPSYLNSDAKTHLDYFDVKMLKKYIEKEIPIFAICRGMQVINNYFGGNLMNVVDHDKSKDEREKCSLVHRISQDKFIDDINPETVTDDVLELINQEIAVNSIHHKAINEPGKDIVPLAKSDDDIIEMICHKELPIIGVQWHPEKIKDPISIEIMNELIEISKAQENE